MALYAASFSVSGVNTANSTLVALKTTSTDRARVREVGLFLAVLPTNAPDLVLVRQNAAGVTPVTGTVVAQDSGDAAAASTLEISWGTRPTVTGGHFRRALLPLTIGAGIVWTMPPGNEIMVPVSSGLCIHNILASGATTGTLNGYIVWDE